MEDISDISSRALRTLSPVTRTLLSELLNPTKVLPHEGRYRDWRGIAALTGVSAEKEAEIRIHNDMFGRVLDRWIASQGGTVGELLQHLITLDRYDVYEDVVKTIREQIQLRPDNQVAIRNENQLNNNVNEGDDYEMITFEDRPGYKHRYHAYILSADEDYEFTSELRSRLTAQGFELCSKENLRPGFASQFPPVVRLIAERCQHVILIYSPDFLTCRDNSFLRDYSHAMSIQQRVCSMIPIVYRECELPMHLRLYTMLRYHTVLGNFWERLYNTLDSNRPRLNGITAAPTAAPVAAATASQNTQQSSTHSAVKIETLPDDDRRYFISKPTRNTQQPETNSLNLPDVPSQTPGNVNIQQTNSLILPDVPSQTPENETLSLVIGNTRSNSSVSLPQSVTSGQRTLDPQIRNQKRPNRLKKFFNRFTRIGRKREKMAAC